MNRRAFTLIELLVVIAIISILLAILMPSLSAAKNLARQVKCLTTLRNTGTAVVIYTEDNNGYLPRSSMTAYMKAAPFKVCPWPEALVLYLGWKKSSFTRFDPDAAEVFGTLFKENYRCPSDPVNNTDDWTYNPVELYTKHFSYGKSVLLEYSILEPSYPSYLRIDNLRAVSGTVLFGEIQELGQMTDHFMVSDWADDGSNATVDGKRHGRTSNYIFCDTHAKPAVFKEMFDPPNGINNFDPSMAR